MDKEVAYYAALVSAWIQTKMIKDQMLVWLSFGSIVVLVLVSIVDKVSSYWQAVLYSCAFLSFGLTVVTVLWIFDRNAKYLKEAIRDPLASTRTLKRLDRIASYSFAFAIFCSIAFGILRAMA